MPARRHSLVSVMPAPHPPLRLVEPLAPIESDLDRVFRAHSGYVAAVAIRLMGRHDEVDDVVQEVFVAAMRGLRSLREPLAIRGWLATVAVRVARRRLRRRRFAAVFGRATLPDYDELIVTATQDKALLIKRAYRILDALPVNAKIAWMLRHVEGEPLDTVAQMCGCSLATAKRRIAAAQTALEQEVRE
jgi:RNA polymerase sigma-70 factor, ECF subfamily